VDVRVCEYMSASGCVCCCLLLCHDMELCSVLARQTRVWNELVEDGSDRGDKIGVMGSWGHGVIQSEEYVVSSV